MESRIDFAAIDLREAFDLAIAIEEDAQRRYDQLSATFASVHASVAEVFRTMAANERKHRDELEARRYSMFREDAHPIGVSLAGAGSERPLPETEPRTARDALLVALASEERAFAFYRDALEHVRDSGVRALFEDLMEEEAEHQALLARQLARLASATAPAVSP